jgi:hypothetical protein
MVTQSKRCGMLTSDVELLYDNECPHRFAHTWALLEHLKWGLSDHPLYSPDVHSRDYHRFAYTTWRNGWDPSASTITSWWKMSKHGWAHRQQAFLTQAYKNTFPNTSASIPVMTTLRSSLSMYIFLYITHFSSLLVSLTAHQRLLSE